MKILLTALAILLIGSAIFAQGSARVGRVNERIAALEASGTRFEPIQLFELVAPLPETDRLWKDACTQADVLQFNATSATALIARGPQNISLAIPHSNGTWVLQLQRSEVITEDFIMSGDDAGLATLPPAVHYRGVMQGVEGSIAAISIFENEVMGILSDQTGERILGRFDEAPVGTHVFYHEDHLRGRSGAVCHTQDDGRTYTEEELAIGEGERTLRCVRFYWEIAYDIVQNKGSVANATNYATGLFNQTAILYDNDGIDVSLSELFVWSSTSPYNATSSFGRLEQFGTVRTSFNGDLAHLIDLGNYGGVAWLNTLCSSTSYRMAYSGINSTYANVPTYSWSVEVVTHEQGHNLGSKHTHACAWNGNNTAIDGCGQSAGYSEGGCPTGPIPTSSVGGTIMSYCHLTSSTIKFANGFGPQPTALITNLVNNASCLLICGSSCDPPSVSATFANTSATISWSNIGASSYDLQWKLSTSSTWTLVTGITGTSHQLNGLTDGTTYNYRVMAQCGGESSAWSSTGSFTTIVICSDVFEPNNSLGTATNIELPVSLNALISTTSDIDYFKFTLEQTANISIAMSNVAGDYDVRLLNTAGSQLAISQNGGTSSENISYSNASPGDYYIHVYGWNGAHHTSQCYLLTASAAGAMGCSIPGGLAAFNVTTTTATIDWNFVQGATSYDLQWKEQDELGWNSIPSISATDHYLTGLFPGTTYDHRIRSNCTGGASLYSTTGNFTTSEDPCFSGVRLQTHVWLDGAYVDGQQLMRDDLRVLGHLPLQEPYTALGFDVGGLLSTTSGVLATSGSTAIVDWVLVEVRDATDPTQVLSARAGLLRRNGEIMSPQGVEGQINFCLPNGMYHVSVRHRNHLACMTSVPVSLSPIGSTVDFRSAAQGTYGNNARRVLNGVARLWAGNTNGDQMVKYSGSNNDRDPILQVTGGIVPTNSIQGYLPTDVNLDGSVKYTGPGNDRDLILSTIGGVVPTYIKTEQMP